MSRISYVNAEIETLFGVDRRDVYEDSTAYVERIHPEDREKYRSLLEAARDQAIEEGTVERRRIEYRIRSGRRSRRIQEIVFPVRNREGALLSWAGLARDVTDRRNREEVLELQTDQLELLNQVVRHDIRNEINLGLDILRSARRQGSIDEENLDRIENIMSHVAELTETARDMTEMITTLTDEPNPIRLAPTLRRVVATISSVSESATVTIDGDVPDVEVRVNELLSAVFRNLLTNAIQHSDREAPEIEISCTLLEERVAVHIADDGPGIPDDKKDVVFESGQTLLGSTGTGFGLPLVETLLDQYGGDIYLSDNEPRGSVFTVVLPLTDSSRET
jgi:PAS domain S-box-containing protein